MRKSFLDHPDIVYIFGAYLIAMPLAAALLTSCTDNQRTKAFGGSMSVQIPCDQQVFDVTWKGEDLWYATQPAPSDWKPAQKRFTEYSSYGMIQGEVVLNESRCGA